MSKSLKRVENALSAAGVSVKIVETPASTRTAAEAAAAAGVALEQIVKSSLFQCVSVDSCEDRVVQVRGDVNISHSC